MRKSNKAKKNDSEEEELEQQKCLQCKTKYKIYTNNRIKKYISAKCKHHFCEDCIMDWRVGWDDNVNVKQRKQEGQEDIATLDCLYPTCTKHHDKIGGNDSQGIQQSYAIDNLMMGHLLKDYVKKMTTTKKTEQKKTKTTTY